MAGEEEKPAGSVTYTLKHPIRFGDEEIRTLTLREALGEDLEELPVKEDGFKVGDFMALAARLADVPPSLIKKLRPADAMEVVGIAAGFLGGGPPTPGSASPN